MTKACKTESVIPLHTCLPCMAGTLQGAFVVIPEISHGDISMHNKKMRSVRGKGKVIPRTLRVYQYAGTASIKDATCDG